MLSSINFVNVLINKKILILLKIIIMFKTESDISITLYISIGNIVAVLLIMSNSPNQDFWTRFFLLSYATIFINIVVFSIYFKYASILYRYKRNFLFLLPTIFIFSFFFFSRYQNELLQKNKMLKLANERLHSSLLKTSYYNQKRIDHYISKLNNVENQTNSLENITNKYNQQKLQYLKQNNYTGRFELTNLNNEIIIDGYLKNGEERGVWTYRTSYGEIEKYKWIGFTSGAICNDGSRSYSTGRGTCSRHGGVDYWLTEYRKVKLN